MRRHNNTVQHLNQITESIWLGDLVASQNRSILQKHGITHILTIGSGLNPQYPTIYHYLWIQEYDAPNANLRKHFDSCTDFINSAISSGGKVLVHLK